MTDCTVKHWSKVWKLMGEWEWMKRLQEEEIGKINWINCEADGSDSNKIGRENPREKKQNTNQYLKARGFKARNNKIWKYEKKMVGRMKFIYFSCLTEKTPLVEQCQQRMVPFWIVWSTAIKIYFLFPDSKAKVFMHHQKIRSMLTSTFQWVGVVSKEFFGTTLHKTLFLFLRAR